jgi:hypothetical protein
VKVTKGQLAVHSTLKQYGPLADHALVPIVQHEVGIHYSSSGIRSRRSELASKGAVVPVDEVVMPSGRGAIVWDVAKKVKVKAKK